MLYVTNSSLARFRECPKRYHYEYVLWRVPSAEVKALAFGSAWHLAMETWWKTAQAHPNSTSHEFAQKAAQAIVGSDKMPREDHAAMIAALLENYAPDYAGHEIVSVEEPFEVGIPNGKRRLYGVRLCGKADVVLENKRGGKAVLDHKSTAREIIGYGDYWKALQFDSQKNNYCLALGATQFVYDAVRKPGIKMCGKDEKAAEANGTTPGEEYGKRCREIVAASPHEYYQMRWLRHDEENAKDAAQDLRWQAEDLQRAIKHGRWYRNSSACIGKHGVCPFIDVCSGRANLDDDTLFRTKESAHEELAQ